MPAYRVTIPGNSAEETPPTPSYVGLSYLPPVIPVTDGSGAEIDSAPPVTASVTTGNKGDEFPRLHPELDWANAMSLCLRCGWWGRRVGYAAHRATDHPDTDDGSTAVVL
jgi:hypothetical protein